MERNPNELDPNEPRDDVTPGGAPATDRYVGQPDEAEQALERELAQVDDEAEAE